MTTLLLPRCSAGALRTRTVLVALALVACAGARAYGQGTIATVGLTPGWATFGEAVPQGLATGGLQIGTLPTQTDVKNRWPDGSIKFAIISASVPTAGNYDVIAATASSGSFTPVVPTASVTLVIGGRPYLGSRPPGPHRLARAGGPLAGRPRLQLPSRGRP